MVKRDLKTVKSRGEEERRLFGEYKAEMKSTPEYKMLLEKLGAVYEFYRGKQRSLSPRDEFWKAKQMAVFLKEFCLVPIIQASN